MAHSHPLEHLEEHVCVPGHWDITHSETPFHPTKMHPTKLHFHDQANHKILEWDSRRHRKGRNLIVKHPDTGKRVTDTKDYHRVRGRRFWAWQPRSLTWWVAQCFLWGSVAWVINGFAVWLQPFAKTRTGNDMGRISALVGGSIFIVGASLAYLEALNVHPKADQHIPQIYEGEHKAATKMKTYKPSTNQPSTKDQMSTSNGPPSLRSAPSLEKHTKPNSDANAVAVAAASEKLAKRNNITQEKRRSRALSTPSPKNNLSPSSSPPPTTSGTPPIASPPTLMPSASTLLNDDDQDRSHAFSVVSDSYDPDSSHIPSRRSSVSSVDTASSSYDSEFPDRVPTPTPPPSPRKIQKPVEKEEEKEDPKRKLKVKGSRWREIGYLAAVSQLIGAYIFYISCITGMRHVIDEDSVGQVQGLYWTPQVVGALGFVISGMLYMYEVQPKWWHIKPGNIGWHIGFWNWLGAIGFCLCGIFGYYAFADKDQEWGTTFSTFWGGWAFLIGSYLQFLEAINK